jgi:hypothetical protein
MRAMVCVWRGARESRVRAAALVASPSASAQVSAERARPRPRCVQAPRVQAQAACGPRARHKVVARAAPLPTDTSEASEASPWRKTKRAQSRARAFTQHSTAGRPVRAVRHTHLAVTLSRAPIARTPAPR